jgi:hypothetical protein
MSGHDTWPDAIEWVALLAAIAYIWGLYINRGGRK